MKSIYRRVRYHPLVESVQSFVRRDPILRIPSINLELQFDPSELIIDCGANVGDVTSLFARTGAAVYAFEPNSLCFSILARRFSTISRVRCFNLGVMDRKATLILNTPKAHGDWDALESTISSSFIPEAMRFDDDAIQKREVDCVDLNEFILSLNSRVRLLKLDIEGAEIPVLNHLIDRGTIELIDLAVVETHEKQIPHLFRATEELRERIEIEGLGSKIRLDWY